MQVGVDAGHENKCVRALACCTQVTMYHKNLARQAQQMAAWLAKRRQENQVRRQEGRTLMACEL